VLNRSASGEIDHQPRRSRAVACLFDCAMHGLFQRDSTLPRDFAPSPGTLLVSNHQRDADVPVLASAVCQRRGFGFRNALPFFAAREDIYARHFLPMLLQDAGWPAPLVSAAGRMPIGGLLHLLRARSLRRVREFTLQEALTALCDAGLGEQTPARWLRPQTLHALRAAHIEVPATLAALAAMRLGPPGRQPWGLRRLQPAAVARIAGRFRSTIDAQLDTLAQLLDGGHVVYLAPEGRVSPDGRMQRPRAAAHLLCKRTQSPLRLQPLAVSYDPFVGGRLRAVVHAGQAQKPPDGSDRRTFDRQLQCAILALIPVTPSHLLAHWLVAGPAEFRAAQCTAWLTAATAALAQAGVVLDPALTRHAAATVTHARLRWLTRRGLLRRHGERYRNCWPRDSAAGWHAPAPCVRYMANALADVVALQPALAARLQP